jgi:hypothetical protein
MEPHKPFLDIKESSNKYIEPVEKIIKPNKFEDSVSTKQSKNNNNFKFKRPSINNNISFDVLNYKTYIQLKKLLTKLN